jgi:hypothetical protein
MRYWQSYRFVFNKPNWLTNLLLTSVCLLIPIVGQIVLIGYLFEVIDALLHRSPFEGGRTVDDSDDAADSEQVMDALPANDDYPSAQYPDFVFNRFADYLMRGVWPFLVRLIIGMAVGLPAGLVLFVGIMVAGVASRASNSPWPILVMYGLFWLFYVVAMLIVSILTIPLYLRAGLSGDFSAAFSMNFFRDFMKRVGKEVVLAELFLAATGTVVTMGGLLLCYVGVFPAAVLLMYASHQLEYQLYELYLKRGGMPVPRRVAQSAHEERSPGKGAPSSRVMRPQREERSTDVRLPEEEW